jgi:hypothetical protein
MKRKRLNCPARVIGFYGQLQLNPYNVT